MDEPVRKRIEIADGISLSYLEAGSGRPLVMLPGLSGSAAKFSRNIPELAHHYRVLAVDPRGNGESDKPTYGYNYHTLARDLDVFLTRLRLGDVTLLGHSAGCKIILTYWEIFDRSRIRSIVFSDDAPCCIGDGAFSYEEAIQTLEGLNGPDSDAFTRRFSAQFVTGAANDQDRAFLAGETFKMPREYHVKLLRWALFGDWWDAVGLVDVPALLIGGRTSKNPWRNMVKFHERIPGSELVIFEEEEGGSHAMYWENPAKYNATILDFLARH